MDLQNLWRLPVRVKSRGGGSGSCHITTQSSGTSVKILVSNFTPGASAPYFGC